MEQRGVPSVLSHTHGRHVPRPGLSLDYPMSLGIYDQCMQAQRVVDYLSDNDFPVRNLAIVGTELKSVERVTGRLTRAKVAAAGAAPFSTKGQLGFLITTPLLGALFTTVWSQLGYAAATRGGTWDFASVSQVVATKYEVLVEHNVAGHARGILAAMPAS